MALLVPSAGSAAGINLSWNDCGVSGAANRTFACNSNPGAPFTLVGSFVAPIGINSLRGMTADLRVMAPCSTLPDWWKFGGAECRGTALSTSFDFSSGPFTCIDFYNGTATGGFTYEPAYGGPSEARLLVQCTIPTGLEGPVDDVTEMYAFKVNVSRAKTTGTSACGGCSQSMRIELRSIQLLQTLAENFDPVLTEPLNGAAVNWQSNPPPGLSASPTAGDVGTPVALTGTRLSNATSVRFSGVEATYTVDSDSHISTSVPPGARSGRIQVQTPCDLMSTSSTFIMAPVLASFDPSEGIPGTFVFIHGYNFVGTTAATFHGVSAGFEVLSDSLVRTKHPPTATDGPITVTNPGGSASSQTDFVVLPMPPTAVGDPSLRALELRRISWSGAGVRAAFSLPATGPATIEIFDSSGRRKASARISGGSVGDHDVEIATALRPGVYFGRLTQDGRSATARFVVLQ